MVVTTMFGGTDRVHAAAPYPVAVLNAMTGPGSVDIYIDGSLVFGGAGFGEPIGVLTAPPPSVR